MRSNQWYLELESDPALRPVRWVDEDAPTIEVPVVPGPYQSHEIEPRPDRLLGHALSLVDSVGVVSERLLGRVLAIVAALIVAMGVFWAVPWAEAGDALDSIAGAASNIGGEPDADTTAAPMEPPTATPHSGDPYRAQGLGELDTPVPDVDSPEATPPEAPTAPDDERPNQDPVGDLLSPPATRVGPPRTTGPSGQVTQAEVDRLQLGMTIDEATQTIGVEGWDFELGFSTGLVMPSEPALVQLQYADTDLSRWALRQWPVEQFGPAFARVVFRDGRAVEINRN